MNLKLILMLFLFSCNEQMLVHEKEIMVYGEDPDITVLPESIDFGNILAGQTEEEYLYVINTGDSLLSITNIALEADNSIYILNDEEFDLEPNEDYIINVNYSPMTYESNTGLITISSNDSDEPVIDVPIIGDGDSPVIMVDKNNILFPDTEIACEEIEEISIHNLGNLDLEIDSITLYGSIPNNYGIDINQNINGALPWDIEPGGFKSISLDYLPDDMIDDVSSIEIKSNDPLNSTVSVTSEGNGVVSKYNTDSFIQKYTNEVDVIFVIDNSGSMTPFQQELNNNFNSFLSVFTQLGIDYRIGLISTDSPTFFGNYIDVSHQDPIGEFVNQLSLIGSFGSAHEKGLRMSYESLKTGSASPSGNFFRTNALLAVIYISDEPDHSQNPYTFYTSYFDSIKQPGLFQAHAVIGDYPSGCSYSYNNSTRTVQFGQGYYEVVQYYSGYVYSICATDWGIQMQNLAFNATPQSTFYLSEQAIEGTIEVLVNGNYVYGWSYDESDGSINFDASNIPAETSSIEITYGVFSDCE